MNGTEPKAYLKTWQMGGQLHTRVDLKPDWPLWVDQRHPVVTPLYTREQKLPVNEAPVIAEGDTIMVDADPFFMQKLCAGIEAVCERDLGGRVGFVLLMFPFADDVGNQITASRINYASNGKRENVVKAMAEMVRRWGDKK